jgi:hypothetical protein
MDFVTSFVAESVRERRNTAAISSIANRLAGARSSEWLDAISTAVN